MDIKFGGLYKIFFRGFLTLTLFSSCLLALLRPFGLSTVTWDGQQMTGVMGYLGPFIFSLVFSLFASLFLAFFAWLSYKIIS